MFIITSDKIFLWYLLVRAVLLSLLLVSSSYAEQEIEVFSSSSQVDQSEILGPLPEGIKAILAMYSLQTGGGCDSRNDAGLVCEFTRTLGLGAQCSGKHLKLVSSWFKNGFPAMSIYPQSTIQRHAKSGQLESICYKSPDTSTVQENWKVVRIKIENNFVLVDAIRNWTFNSADGPYYRIQYKSKYRIDDHTISVISHKEIPLEEQQ